MVKEDAEVNRVLILAEDQEEGDKSVHYNYYKYISVVPHIFMDTSTDE